MCRTMSGSYSKLFRLAFLASLTLTLIWNAPEGWAAQGDCGQPLSSGGGPVASDCLFILNAAVGLQSCETSVCDLAGGSGGGDCRITASDALHCLTYIVGTVESLDCRPCGESTTTTTLPPTDNGVDESAACVRVKLLASADQTRAMFGCHAAAASTGGLVAEECVTAANELVATRLMNAYGSSVCSGIEDLDSLVRLGSDHASEVVTAFRPSSVKSDCDAKALQASGELYYAYLMAFSDSLRPGHSEGALLAAIIAAETALYESFAVAVRRGACSAELDIELVVSSAKRLGVEARGFSAAKFNRSIFENVLVPLPVRLDGEILFGAAGNPRGEVSVVLDGGPEATVSIGGEYPVRVDVSGVTLIALDADLTEWAVNEASISFSALLDAYAGEFGSGLPASQWRAESQALYAFSALVSSARWRMALDYQRLSQATLQLPAIFAAGTVDTTQNVLCENSVRGAMALAAIYVKAGTCSEMVIACTAGTAGLGLVACSGGGLLCAHWVNAGFTFAEAWLQKEVCGSCGDLPCDDGNLCNGIRRCNYDEGECYDGVSPPGCAQAGHRAAECQTCDPTYRCAVLGQCPTIDACEPRADGLECKNDGNSCTRDECSIGACKHWPIPDGTQCADDGNTCTADSCEAAVCKHTPDDEATCNDSDNCTLEDFCSSGQCTGMQRDCGDTICIRGECSECVTDTDCTVGNDFRFCVDYACVDCKFSSHCEADQDCRLGECVPSDCVLEECPECVTDEDCTVNDTARFCKKDASVCVECVSDAQCPDPDDFDCEENVCVDRRLCGTVGSHVTIEVDSDWQAGSLMAIVQDPVTPNGTIAITASGGDGGYEYSLDGGANFGLDSALENLAAGTYNVSARDASGCLSASVSVEVNPAFPLVANLAGSKWKGCVPGCTAGPENCCGLYEGGVWVADGASAIACCSGASSSTYTYQFYANGDGTMHARGISGFNGFTIDYAINAFTESLYSVCGSADEYLHHCIEHTRE